MNPGTAALSRGLDVLVALAEPEAARTGLGVAQLTELIGADKSQLSRTLATLDEQGFVTRDPDTLAYRLGWRLFSLAARSGDAPLIAAARPVLLALVAEGRLATFAHEVAFDDLPAAVAAVGDGSVIGKTVVAFA